MKAIIIKAVNSEAKRALGNVRARMIRLTVRETALREGVENPNALAELSGLPYETCRKLWLSISVRLDLNTIESLCDALRCRPKDLFDYEFEPSKPRRKRGSKKRR